jgi:hypothetical protein
VTHVRRVAAELAVLSLSVSASVYDVLSALLKVRGTGEEAVVVDVVVV